MFLLHPPRLKKALEVLDTDGSGEVDVDEWETAINRGLAKRLEQMAKERERRERAAAAADEEFSAEFLTAARKVRSSVQSSPVPARAFVLLFGVLFVSLAWHATLVFGTLVGKLSGIGISGLRLELCSNGIQHGITLVGYRCYPSNSPSLRIGSLGLCLSAAA